MKTFTRDATVHITAKFTDADGNVLNPASATVTLSYQQNCECVSQTYAMALSGDEWQYDWDSRNADCGVVQGHAQTGDVPVAAVDFEFRLTANKGNKNADG